MRASLERVPTYARLNGTAGPKAEGITLAQVATKVRRASNVISSVARASGVELPIGRRSEVSEIAQRSDVGVADGRGKSLPEVLPSLAMEELAQDGGAIKGDMMKVDAPPTAELVGLVVDRRCSSAAASAPPPPPSLLHEVESLRDREGSLDTRDGDSCSRRV